MARRRGDDRRREAARGSYLGAVGAMRYPLVVAITGASGTVYAQRLLQRALEHFDSIGLTISRHAFRVMEEELLLKVAPAEFRTEMLLPDTPGTERIYYH